MSFLFKVMLNDVASWIATCRMKGLKKKTKCVFFHNTIVDQKKVNR